MAGYLVLGGGVMGGKTFRDVVFAGFVYYDAGGFWDIDGGT